MRCRIDGVWRTVMEYSHACFSQNPMTVLGPEPGIAAQHNVACPPGPAEVAAEFLEEPFHAPGGVRGSFAHPCREDLTGIGPEGEERVLCRAADYVVAEEGLVICGAAPVVKGHRILLDIEFRQLVHDAQQILVTKTNHVRAG